ncbi:hypothetical protein ACOME3_008908 [Neoechinorhynchus agilis]
METINDPKQKGMVVVRSRNRWKTYSKTETGLEPGNNAKVTADTDTGEHPDVLAITIPRRGSRERRPHNSTILERIRCHVSLQTIDARLSHPRNQSMRNVVDVGGGVERGPENAWRFLSTDTLISIYCPISNRSVN